MKTEIKDPNRCLLLITIKSTIKVNKATWVHCLCQSKLFKQDQGIGASTKNTRKGCWHSASWCHKSVGLLLDGLLLTHCLKRPCLFEEYIN